MFEVQPVGYFNLGPARIPVKRKLGRTDYMKYCLLLFKKLYAVDVTEKV